VILFASSELAALGNSVPFLQAAAAARRGCVLRDKDRMSLEWCLLSVIHGKRRREAAGYEIPSVLDNGRHSFPPQIIALL
jgi:hypothetical protein